MWFTSWWPKGEESVWESSVPLRFTSWWLQVILCTCLHPRGVDTADYTYSTIPRRCGGSHTLTYPYRRNRPQHLSPLEEVQIAMKV